MSFNLPAAINKTTSAGPGSAGTGTVTDVFAYGPEQQRGRQTVTTTGGPNAGTTAIVYGGSIEKETRTQDNLTIVKTYLPNGVMVYDRYAGTGANITQAPATRQIRYSHRDRLGSVTAITDEAGTVVERLSYDVWGKRRNTDGSTNHAIQPASPENREGFTEHEHLDVLGLVHMNGRIYDPTIARFMSADPTVPDPNDTQNLNRYSYVLNNPTVYTDPSGFAQVREFDSTVPGLGRVGGFGGMFREGPRSRENEYLERIPSADEVLRAGKSPEELACEARGGPLCYRYSESCKRTACINGDDEGDGGRGDSSDGGIQRLERVTIIGCRIGSSCEAGEDSIPRRAFGLVPVPRTVTC
jgi:RHS repeat-associated protein